MSDQEPLMYDARADDAIALLISQLTRLVAHHNDTHDDSLRIDSAQLVLHVPAFAMTQRRDLVAMPAGEGWVKSAEAADRLSVIPGTIRQLVLTGKLEAQKVGDRAYISEASIERYRAERGPRQGGRHKKKDPETL